MKVNLNLNTETKSIDFKGYKPVKDDRGFVDYEFNFPFDDNKYDCYVEFFRVENNDNDYSVKNIITPEKGDSKNPEQEKGVKLTPGKNIVNLGEYNIDPDESFAYHYKFYPKGTTGTPFYDVDAGNKINNTQYGANKIYNVIVQNGSKNSKGGSMKLLLPDSHNAIFVYDPVSNKPIINPQIDNARKSIKNFANKVGGSLAGIEKDIEYGKFDGYSRIISTPIFTDDSLTAHAYWNKNCMQMAHSIGNINNYASMQKKLFAKGINFVSDGAFVNEGLEGIHFRHVLKYGQKSPYFNWFRVQGLKNANLKLGILPKNQEFVSHRIVQRDSKSPMYIQIYDNRLVDPTKLDPKELIKKYDETNTKNALEINTHNDTVIPYSFELTKEDYEAYQKNVKDLKEHNRHVDKDHRIEISSPEATRLLMKFPHWEAEEKIESGFETWDANPDIAKLNFAYSHTDTKNMRNMTPAESKKYKETIESKNFEVQDYAIASGQYWTKKTNQILTMHIAQNLKNINSKDPKETFELIKNNIENKQFPQVLTNKLNENVVKNVLTTTNAQRNYILEGDACREDYKDQIIEGLMNLPLDTVEVGDNIVSALSSPYISKRATSAEDLGKSRYELHVQDNPHVPKEYLKVYSQTDNMYKNQMYSFAKEILEELNTRLPQESKLYADTNTTPYGKYILPIVTAEIARFAVIKGLVKDATYKVDKDNGEITYDYNKLKQTSLQSIGIIPNGPEDEASSVISKLKSGISGIKSTDKDELVAALEKSLKGTNEFSFKLAEMILDRSGAGLDWRIDAAKDIADIEALKEGHQTFDGTWDQVVDFWKGFTQNVLKENNNSYIAAEITDENDLHRIDKLKKGEIFNNLSDDRKEEIMFGEFDITRNLLRQTGITTTANYSYFFSTMPEIFAKSFETGSNSTNENGKLEKLIYEKLVGKDNYLESSSLESLLYSYTFIGNHDKPRALHGLAMDMELFYSDLTDPAKKEYREIAYRLVNDIAYDNEDKKATPEDIANFDYSRISPKNIAMANSLQAGFGDALKKLKNSGKYDEKRKEEIDACILKSLSDLSRGSYLGKNFEAEAFGVKPFDITIDIVLDQAEKKHGLKISKAERKMIADEAFYLIMNPAISKLKGMMKFLVALPGNPTLFSGDELGATGYEQKTKNIYLQNRNFVHHDWADKKSPYFKEFIKDSQKEIEKIMALRSNPNLRALNEGAIFALKKQGQYSNIPAILRQSTDGAMAISLFNATNTDHDFKNIYTPNEVTIPSISLDTDFSNKYGIKGGIKEGTVFKNADPDDTANYIVKRNDNGSYYIEHEKGHYIHIKDTTMILYHVPDSPVEPKKSNKSDISMKGRRVLYNPQYHFVSNPYAQTKTAAIGSKLQLNSK